jgi:hypothetical protein
MKQAAYRRTKVFTVILVQTFCPHPSIEQREPDEQIDRAVTVVLKFVTFNLSRSHRLFSGGTFQNLDPRFFVNGNDHYPVLPQESNSLVIPKDFEGPGDCEDIPDRGLPIAKAMGLEMTGVQDIVHGRVVDARNDFLFNGCQLEAAGRSVRNVPANRGRVLAGQSLNALPGRQRKNTRTTRTWRIIQSRLKPTVAIAFANTPDRRRILINLVGHGQHSLTVSAAQQDTGPSCYALTDVAVAQ